MEEVKGLRPKDMGVSTNKGFPPKSSILIGVSMKKNIHFGWFPPIFGNTHMGYNLQPHMGLWIPINLDLSTR